MSKKSPSISEEQYVQSSTVMWHKFVKYALYATVHVVVILLLMALFLL